jgi:hypothetical protein
VRALVVLATTCGSVLLLAGSAYLASVPAAFRPPIPSERYTFYVVPIFLAVFAAWLEGGAVRTRGAWWLAGASGLLPVVAAALYLNHDPHGTFSGLAFLPWVTLGLAHPAFTLGGLSLYCGWCTWLLARGCRSDLHGLLKPVLGLMVVTLASAAVFFVSAPTYSAPPGWLDSHTKGRVIAVWGITPPPIRSEALGEMIAANDRLSAVYFMRGSDSRGFGSVETRVRARPDGTVVHNQRPLAADYVLTDARTRFVGDLVTERDGFAIYKVSSTVRLSISETVAKSGEWPQQDFHPHAG